MEFTCRIDMLRVGITPRCKYQIGSSSTGTNLQLFATNEEQRSRSLGAYPLTKASSDSATRTNIYVMSSTSIKPYCMIHIRIRNNNRLSSCQFGFRKLSGRNHHFIRAAGIRFSLHPSDIHLRTAYIGNLYGIKRLIIRSYL